MAVLQTNEILKERLSRKEGMRRLSSDETEAIKRIVLETTLDVAPLLVLCAIRDSFHGMTILT